MTDPAPAIPPAKPHASRVGPVLLGVVLGIWLVYSLAWSFTAKLIQGRITDWIALQQGDAGLAITTAEPHVGGFPGKVKVTLPDVTVKAPENNGGWSWYTPQVIVETWPLMMRHLEIDLSGTHQVAGLLTPTGTTVALSAGQAIGGLALDWSGHLHSITLQVADVSAQVPAIAHPVIQIGHGSATVAAVEAPPAQPGNSATLPTTSRMTLDATDVRFPGWLPAPLDHAIDHAAATLEITGVVPPGPLPQVLETWRTGGGTFEVRSVELDWPPLKLAGNGSLALDAALQPMGAFSLDVQGGDGAINSFAAAGWMGKTEAGLAHVGLAALSGKATDGKTEELHVPLMLENHHLSAGPVTVLTVPAVFWPKVVVP